MDDPDDDTVLTPRCTREVRHGVDTEDTVVREWVPPPVRQPAVSDILEAIDRARAIDHAGAETGDAETGDAGTAADRPPDDTLHSFRIGESSEPMVLDVPAYIGRRPSSPRIQSGILPRLITVPSPQREVSSTHLEIRQLGSTVIVTDLKTTNGSVVMPPGGPSRKLRQGESVVVSTGALVDIGDGNIIEILPSPTSTRAETRAPDMKRTTEHVERHQ